MFPIKVAVVMAGGVGSRLYPISNEKKPKQFLPLLSDEPMLDTTIERLKPLFSYDEIEINTIKKYEEKVEDYPHHIIIEPDRMGTTLSTMSIVFNVLCRYEDAIICLIPSDHYIEGVEEYQRAIEKGMEKADEGFITLIGLEPDRAESQYGYIETDGDGVLNFFEKPDEETAKEYIDQGYLWNAGIFIFRASVMKREIHRLWPFTHKNIEKAIIEKQENLAVVKGEFGWDDIGSMDRLKKVREVIGWQDVKPN